MPWSDGNANLPCTNRSEKSGGTKIADARVLRSRPNVFSICEKVISPCVASPSDAAPVMFSVESPTSSPRTCAASSLRVKVNQTLHQRFPGSALVSAIADISFDFRVFARATKSGIQAAALQAPFARESNSDRRHIAFSHVRRVILCSSEAGVFDEGLHASSAAFVIMLRAMI